MNKDMIFGCLSFIPWILYFVEIVFYRIGVIETIGNGRKTYFSYIDNHFFSSLNVKELVLLFIFVSLMLAGSSVILKVLFPAIYIFLLIDFFKSLARDCKKIHHKCLMVMSVILLSMIILLYLFTDQLYLVYIMMFAVSILSGFWIYIFSSILKLKIKA